MNKCYLFAGLLCASSDVSGMLVDTAFDLNVNGKREIRQVDIFGKVNPNKRRSSVVKSVRFADEICIKNSVNTQDKNGNALLHHAIVKANKKNSAKNLKKQAVNQKNEDVLAEIKSLIEQGANINQKNNEGDFPAKIAFMCGKQDIVKYLLEKGADINQQDRHGNALLHLASLEDNEEMITYLVELGADINQQNSFGQTPLHFSTYWSCLREKEKEKIMAYLIDHGADANKKDKNDQTPLKIAKQKDNENAIAYLLEHGAK